MFSSTVYLAVWAAIATLAASSMSLVRTDLQRDAVPSVDLGYEVHTATTNVS